MKYDVADIVRIKGRKGLFEITRLYKNKTYDYAVTNNECETESYVNENEIILVCSVYQRRDI